MSMESIMANHRRMLRRKAQIEAEERERRRFDSEVARHAAYEDYVQRMTTKQWKKLLLDNRDKVVFNGVVRRLVGKSLGAGVVEVAKVPIEVKMPDHVKTWTKSVDWEGEVR
jgi:hypothetical protein